MELGAFIEIIGTLGFPIAAVIALAAFVFHIYKDTKAESKTREDKLYEEIAEGRRINGKFADIIAKYEVQFTEIKQDIKEIKEDVLIISEKIS